MQLEPVEKSQPIPTLELVVVVVVTVVLIAVALNICLPSAEQLAVKFRYWTPYDPVFATQPIVSFWSAKIFSNTTHIITDDLSTTALPD